MGKGHWIVHAGVIPGVPVAEHSRQFPYSAAEWEADRHLPDGQPTRFEHLRDEALRYAAGLMNPGLVNWVHLEFCWY